MTNCIINLRGTSGSGKTHTTRCFLDYLPCKTIEAIDEQGKQRILGYKLDGTPMGLKRPIIVIGSYENTCGGTDTINKQEWIGDRVEKAYKTGAHVLVEGLLMSKSAAGGHLAPRLHGLGLAYFLFLDTPKEVCVERVLARRAAKGNDTPFDPEKTLLPAHKQVHKSKVLLDNTGDGYRTLDVPHLTAHKEMLRLMLEAENI